MSKFEQAIETYKKSLTEKLDKKSIDEDLLRAVAKSCGPSIYKADASKVACSDKKELEKIRQNFLIKKLGLSDENPLDEAIKEVCAAFGSANRNKYRVVFYYLLVERFSKQAVFMPVEQKTAKETNKSKKSHSHNNQKMNHKSTDTIIHDHALYAAGLGFIPIPIVDLAGITVVQYKMIKKLADTYNHVSFDETKAKSILAAITGGFTSFELGLFTRIIFKGVPFFGPIIGGTAISGFAYFSTKIIGQIFDEHFASGGDLSVEELTVNKMREMFRFEMKKGTSTD